MNCKLSCQTLAIGGLALLFFGSVQSGNAQEKGGFGGSKDLFQFQDDWSVNLSDESWYLFQAGEFYIDVGYLQMKVDNSPDLKIGGPGPEAGNGVAGSVGYYFHRNLGFSFDFMHNIDRGDRGAGLSVAALVDVRIPIDHAAIAPYFSVGPGYHSEDIDQWSVQVGGGIEVRLLENLGAYFDARFIEPESGYSMYALQAGVRILF